MKYKVGDRVKIKSLDWYNENKDEDDNVVCLYSYFDKDMSEFCNKIVTIKSLHGCPNVKAFRIIEDDGYSWWSDDMIEGLVEEESKNWAAASIPDGPYTVTYDSPSMSDSMNKNNIHNEMILPKGYVFKDENGNVINASKIVLEKKEYPKTYEECCEILGCKSDDFFTDFSYKGCDVEISDYEDKIDDLLQNFRKLIYCRDAYWKIAGEEMGLGKPWEPDWTIESSKYIILFKEAKIEKHITCKYSRVLAFPTEEMRDAFYENFKELIEQCKELL